MPLSLVLHATFATWHRDLARWSAWNQIVDLEEILLERARGAFLARWFGAGLPTSRNALLVNIANLDELRTRYAELRRGAMLTDSDRNLTEPLAGVAGTLAGALLSPTSSLILMPVIAEQFPSLLARLAAALNTITFGGVGVLIAVLAIPIVGLGAPYLALTQPLEAAAVFGLLGALTGFFIAARRLIEQLVGPREEVQNPLLKKILDVLDDVATLVPFLFVLADFVINTVAAKLAPLAELLDLLITLAEDVFSVISFAISDLFERLQGLYAGKDSPWQVVLRIVGSFRRWFAFMARQIGELLAAGGKLFETVPVAPAAGEKGPPKTELRIWHDFKEALGKLESWIKELTSESWLVLRFKAIGERLTKIADILGSVPSKPDEGGVSGWIKGRLLSAGPQWPADLVWPPAPVIENFPSAQKIFDEQQRIADGKREKSSRGVEEAFKKTEPHEGYAFILDKDARAAFDKIRRPPENVFAAERKALLARPELEGKSFEKFLAKAKDTEAKLRSSLFAVIDGLLPDLVAQYVPTLQGLFWELDAVLYQTDTAFPVRDLPGGDTLNVKVGRLRVNAPGMKAAHVRAWGKDLKIALENQVFRTGVAAAN